jgi:hypothetical protein
MTCTCSPPIIDPVCPVEEHRNTASEQERLSAIVAEAREQFACDRTKEGLPVNPDYLEEQDWDMASEVFVARVVKPWQAAIAERLHEMARMHEVPDGERSALVAAAAIRIGGRLGWEMGWVCRAIRFSNDYPHFVACMRVLADYFSAELSDEFLHAAWSEVFRDRHGWLRSRVSAAAMRTMESMPTVADLRRLADELAAPPPGEQQEWTSTPMSAVKHRVEIAGRVGYVYEYPNGKAWARLENPDEKLGSFPDVDAARRAVLKAAGSR